MDEIKSTNDRRAKAKSDSASHYSGVTPPQANVPDPPGMGGHA